MGSDQSEVEKLKKTLADLESELTRERKEKDRLELVVESAPNGIILFNEKGEIVLVNHMVETLFGYSREKFTDLSIEDLFPESAGDWHRQDRENDPLQPEFKPLGAGRDLYAIRQDGTEFPVGIGLKPVSGENELHVLASVVDISERKRAEEALNNYAIELERTNAELESFVSFASHDLQEPLRKIRTMGERLAKMTDGSLDERSAEYLKRMINASDRMHRLILDLLALSRVSTRASPPGKVDLNELIDDVLSTFEIVIEESGSTVEVGDLPFAEVDRSQFRQVFQNLIGNSLKFSNSRVPTVIQVTGRIHEDDTCEIEIKDNGIGFEKEYSDMIFDVFQRLHGRSKYEGSGIGLAVCKKIVERHGGSIEAHGKPGEGAEFRIRLPHRQKESGSTTD